MLNLQVPAATADPTEHADWLEFAALQAPSSEASAQDLVTAIRRIGSSDAIPGPAELEDEPDDADQPQDWSDGDSDVEVPPLDDAVEKEGEELERIADDAIEQLEQREQYLDDQYPFTIDGILKAKPGASETAYAFLATVTSFNWTNEHSPENAASLFEYLSATALVRYLGGRHTVCSYDFGFPRRNSPPAFYDAVQELCEHMGEGLGCKAARSETADVKDDKLDLVAWIPFRDCRPNQFSVFGQCATGANWRDKINELQPIDFCKRWLIEQPAMNPSLAFFVPRHIKEDHWPIATNGDRRLVFDRLRITHLLRDLDEDLARRCAAWTASVLG